MFEPIVMVLFIQRVSHSIQRLFTRKRKGRENSIKVDMTNKHNIIFWEFKLFTYRMLVQSKIINRYRNVITLITLPEYFESKMDDSF